MARAAAPLDARRHGGTRMQATHQRTEGQGKQPEHTHPATLHEHDHYHVTHEHSDNPLNEWVHRTYWHTHEHNHASLTHSHDQSRQEEDERHAKEAHVHDHTSPTKSPS